MKRVSFEVAKAIKEAGYPQNIKSTVYYSSDGYLCTDGSCNYVCSAPYVMEVWLWLAKEKQIHIDVTNNHNDSVFTELYIGKEMKYLWDLTRDDIEDAIEAAIEYLVEHNLIK